MANYTETVVRMYYTAQDVIDFLVETPGATLVVEYDTGTLLIQNHGLEGFELRVSEDDVYPNEIFQAMAQKLGFSIHFT